MAKTTKKDIASTLRIVIQEILAGRSIKAITMLRQIITEIETKTPTAENSDKQNPQGEKNDGIRSNARRK